MDKKWLVYGGISAASTLVGGIIGFFVGKKSGAKCVTNTTTGNNAAAPQPAPEQPAPETGAGK